MFIFMADFQCHLIENDQSLKRFIGIINMLKKAFILSSVTLVSEIYKACQNALYNRE